MYPTLWYRYSAHTKMEVIRCYSFNININVLITYYTYYMNYFSPKIQYLQYLFIQFSFSNDVFPHENEHEELKNISFLLEKNSASPHQENIN